MGTVGIEMAVAQRAKLMAASAKIINRVIGPFLVLIVGIQPRAQQKSTAKPGSRRFNATGSPETCGAFVSVA
jgi:hypothetical protein